MSQYCTIAYTIDHDPAVGAKKGEEEQQLQQHCEAVYKSLVNYLKGDCCVYFSQL